MHWNCRCQIEPEYRVVFTGTSDEQIRELAKKILEWDTKEVEADEPIFIEKEKA